MGDWQETQRGLERADVGMIFAGIGALMLISAVVISVAIVAVTGGSAAPPWAAYTVAVLAPLGIAALLCGVVIVFAATFRA